METVTECQPDPHTKERFPSNLSGYPGIRMSVKRPSTEDSRYPPKKRALLEHRAQERESLSSGFQKKDVGLYDENWKRAESLKFKHEIPQTYTRQRSDSLHSNFSVISESSDAVSTVSREDSPYPYQTLYDHRTPERNPIKSLNTQIVKPLFQNSDSEHSAVESDKSSYEESEAGVGVKKEFEIASTGVCNGNERKEFVVTGQETRKDAFEADYIPKSMIGAVRENSVSNVQGDFANFSGNYSNGAGINLENSSTGPMVSLIHRFNAEVPVSGTRLVENLHSQSDRLPFSQTDNAPIMVDNLPAQSNSRSHDSSSSSHDQSGVLQRNRMTETEEQGKEIYKCPICSRLLKQRGHFLVHLKSHEEQNCKCRICGEELQSLEKLQQHMKNSHKGDNPYKCEHCSREFSQYNNLRRHLRVHRAKIYKCELCDREFNEEFYLTMHMGTHTGKRVYSCGVCNACFSSSHDLKMHVKTHSPSQLHTCDVCGKSFSKACVLRQHKKGHSGDRPHKCEKCLKTFIHRHHLTMHMRSHTDNKPYTCDICKKEFYQSSHLYKHLRCHDNENDISAVNAIKDRLDKNNPIKMVEKGRPKVSLPMLAQKITLEEDRNNVFESHSAEKSRSVSASDYSAADGKVLRSVTTSEQQMYRIQHPSQAVPSTIPSSFAPPAFGMPHFPMPNYNHLYQAYAAQARAYYDNMYMMNYMSQNAMLHSGNSVKQNSGYHSTQTTLVSTLNGNYVSKNETVPGRANVNREEKKPVNEADVKTVESVESVEEKKRAEVAEELLKMSKARTEAVENKAAKIFPFTTNDSYVVDQSRTMDFTKCIGDVIDKAMRLQEKPPHMLQLLGKAGNAEMENQFIGREPAVKGHAGPTRTANNQYTALSTPLKYSGSTLNLRPDHQDEVLNLSQRKVKRDFTPPQGKFSPQVSRTDSFLGNHALNSSSVWNYPSYVLSHHVHPAQRFPPSLPNFYPNLVPSYGLPHPPSNFSNQLLPSSHGNYQSAHIRSPVLGNQNDSPKKRHASYHDMNRSGVALDLRNADTSSRSRHMSEHFADIFSRSRSVAGIRPGESTLSDSQNIKTEVEEVGREVTPLVKSEQESQECENDEATEANMDENDSVEDKHGTMQELVTSSETFSRKIEPGTKNETQSSGNSESDISVCDNGQEIVKQKDFKVDNLPQNGNYFDDSLDEKKLEIDFGHGEEKSSEDSLVEIGRNKVEKDLHDAEVNENESMSECLPVIENDDSKMTVVSEHVDADKATDRSDFAKDMVLDTNKDDVDEEKEMSGNDEMRNETGNNPELNFADHRSEATMTCGLCWKKFSTTEEMERHQVVHARELNARNTCHHCDRVFARPFDLQCHILKLHSDTSLLSENQKDIRSDSKSTELVKEEIERGGFECEFCGSKIPTLEEFRNHLSTHKGDKPYICNICLRNFAHKHNLNRHKMSHNSKSFECTVCQRTFKESFYLQMHMKIHSEEKTQRCEICNKQVPKSEIWKHTSEHLGNIVENPTYEQIGHRVQEILRAQNSNKGVGSVMNTELLTEQFQKVQQANGSLDQLAKLMQLTGGDIDRTENIENLNIPMSSNDSNDPKGPKIPLTARNVGDGNYLKEIVNSFGNRNVSKQEGNLGDISVLECHICQLGFKTKREFVNHLGLHSGTRAHVCRTCGKGFRKKSVLRTHEKIHQNSR